MTGPGSAGAARDDLASLADLPRVVLDADGLDLLELTLAGALPDAAALLARAGTAVAPPIVLTDAENTPLAVLEVAGTEPPTARPLRPLPAGHGPQWEPRRRRSPSDVRAELGGPRGARHPSAVAAFVVDDIPTRGDVDAVVGQVRAGRDAAALVVAPVSRRPRPPGEPTPGALARAATVVADRLGEAVGAGGPSVIPLVVPWPIDARGIDLSSVLEAYGATDSTSVTALRSPADAARVADLPSLVEHEVADLYPGELAGEVTSILRGAGRADERGAVVLFTGLSGSGKSTIARALADELREDGRRVTLLDGDEVRQLLSSDLGFDVASRERNVERIAYVASLVAGHGGIAIAAPIAPFESGRRRARQLVGSDAAFVLVHVSTPLDVCEARDRKGLYARARAGEIAEFTGISSPYEPPDDADVVVDTSAVDVEESVRLVRAALLEVLAPGAST